MNQSEEKASPAKSPTEALSEQLAYWRDRRNLTAQQLADRVASIGGKLDPQAISKIETRNRGVSLDEALLLAYALTVPPPLLFLPLGREDLIAIAPDVTVHPDLAWKWVEGLEPPTDSNRYVVRPGEWREAALPVALHREFRQAGSRMQAATLDKRLADLSRNPDRTAAAQDRYADALGSLAEALNAMTDAGLRVPGGRVTGSAQCESSVCSAGRTTFLRSRRMTIR